jgi:hypothetical protein
MSGEIECFYPESALKTGCEHCTKIVQSCTQVAPGDPVFHCVLVCSGVAKYVCFQQIPLLRRVRRGLKGLRAN